MAPNPDTNETEKAEELVPRDDSVIGRALRHSLLALLLVGIIAGAIILIVHWKHATPARPDQPSVPAGVPSRARPEPPTVLFSDITRQSGIHFVHASGATGQKLLPETMGGGVAFLDYDNDGKPDILFVNSASRANQLSPALGKGPTDLSHVKHSDSVPEAEPSSSAAGPSSQGIPSPNAPATTPTTSLALYHNDGNGHFTNVTPGSGLDVPIYGMGVAVGDYDNDGRVDILITGVGGCRLFHNEGNGHFRDVTSDAGVGGSGDDWSTSAAFFDYDNDGRLDLFVCNYVRWSRELDEKANYTLTGIGRAYGPPTGFEGAFCKLYHNDGGGHFTDVSAKAGIQIRNKDTGAPLGKSLGVLPIDLDGDGYMDLIVANDTVQNFLFHNKKDGTFEEIGIPSGVAFDSNGAARGGMGVDAAYFRNDTSIGIAVGNFANEMLAFYAGQTPGSAMHFTDDAIAVGLSGPSRLPLKFGVLFFDYDLDGWPDLLCANGHLENEIAKVQPGQSYQQPAQLYWNAGGKNAGFIAATAAQSGSDLFKPIVGRGCAYADIDGDGDLDLILTQIDGPPLLLRNDQHTGHHFLRLKLIGTTCNRDAIGAWATVQVGRHTIRQQVMPTHGYLSQSELPVTIGLGDATHPDSIEITWPGGDKQRVGEFKVDGLTEIQQVATQPHENPR